MSEESRNVISDAFSTQTAHFASLIDDLVKSHPQETEFIFDKSNQHAWEVALIAQRYAQGSSRDLSHDLHRDASNDAYSTSVLSPMLIADGGSLPSWQLMSSQPLHENLFDPDLLNLNMQGLFSDIEQTSAFLEQPDFITHPNDSVQVDISTDRAVTELLQCENVSCIAATNNVGTIVQAALNYGARDEFDHSNVENSAQHLGTCSSTQIAAPAHATGAGKIPNSAKTIHQRDSTLRLTCIAGRTHPSAEPQGILSLQDQPVLLSASDDVEPRDACIRKRRKKDHDSDQDLKNFCHATGSPDSLCQLKDILATIRGSGIWKLIQRTSTIAETIQVLDGLDCLQQASFYVRRIYLLKLWKLREGLLENVTKPKLGETQHMSMVGKKESNVLDNLVTEVYPHVIQRPQEACAVHKWRKQYRIERKSLMNKFQAATKWNSLSERFSPGILALIPSGGQFQIQNQKLETLSAKALECLLCLLEEKSGGCIRGAADLLTPYVNFILEGTDLPPPLRFESIAKEQLINMMNQDPSTLVNLCLEESSSPL